MKPKSVVINDAGHSYFNYEHPPWYSFEEFETLVTSFAMNQPQSNITTWVDVTIVMSDEFCLQCRFDLSREQNFCFTDYVGNLLYLMENDDDYKQLQKDLAPIFAQIKFTIH